MPARIHARKGKYAFYGHLCAEKQRMEFFEKMKIVQSKILGIIFFRQFAPFCLHNFGAQNKDTQ